MMTKSIILSVPCWTIILFLFASSVCPSSLAADFIGTFYISPHGSDSNPGTREKPLASLERARQAVREVLPQMTADVTVYIDPGDYYVEETIVFEHADSGRSGHTVTYRTTGSPGSARFIGARRLDSWEPQDGNIWKTSVEPGWVFHTLYESGERARKARHPNAAYEPRFTVASAPYLLADDRPGIRYKAGDLDPLDWDLRQAELVISPFTHHDWELLTLPIESIDPATRTLHTKLASRSDPDYDEVPVWSDFESDSYPPGKNSRYFVQGIPQLLDEPGEFHLDPKEGILYYWPIHGNPNQNEIFAPTVKTLLLLEGLTRQQQVQHIGFQGLRFEATDFTDYYRMFSPEVYRTGMIRLTNSTNIEFRHCHFKNAGFTAVLMHDGNTFNSVYGCRLENAAGGIWANTTPGGSFNVGHNFINNLILNMGTLAHSPGVGIKLHESRNSEVAHCHVRDVARWGISIRGRADSRTSNSATPGDNLVRHTIVERGVQDSADAGALHTANVSLNEEPYNVNTFRQMLVHDTRAHPSYQDAWGPNGIFTDFESFGQRFENVQILGTYEAADFRFNPVQGPNPPGLTPDHTFINVSWEAGFDPSQMDYDQIGLLPDFPAEYLDRTKPILREDFNAYEAGPLHKQGNWIATGTFGPTLESGVPGTDGSLMGGPAQGPATGLVAAEMILPGGLGLSPNAKLVIEFDIIQRAQGNIPSFGIGGSVTPASIGILQGTFEIRAEDFGIQQKARTTDGEIFQVALETLYRVRSIWDLGANGGGGRATLAVKNLSAGERRFRPLFFADGGSGFSPTANLEIVTNPETWHRAWLRAGYSGQSTYLDNIDVSHLAPAPLVSSFAQWQKTHFTAEDLQDPSVSAPDAAPAGDGVANLIKFAFGFAPFDRIPAVSLPQIRHEAGRLRLTYVRPGTTADARSSLESSPDLRSWLPATRTWETVSIEEISEEEIITLQRMEPEESETDFLRLSFEAPWID